MKYIQHRVVQNIMYSQSVLQQFRYNMNFPLRVHESTQQQHDYLYIHWHAAHYHSFILHFPLRETNPGKLTETQNGYNYASHPRQFSSLFIGL